MSATGSHRRKMALAGGLFWLAAAACAPVAERINRATDGPERPADTAVHIGPERTEKLEASTGPAPSPAGPLAVSISDAILLCLENNRSLVVQRLVPSIRQTVQDQERSVFDPVLDADAAVARANGERLAGSGARLEPFTTDTVDGVISLQQLFPTGTTLALEAGTQMNEASYEDGRLHSTRLGLTVTQALLRGYGTEANLARLEQARLDTRMSEYELRGFAETLVAEVERAFWDYALARRRIEIVEKSLTVARQQRRETEELIAVGRLARAELAAVRAEVAAQEQALIEAHARKETIRLHLLRLLNPPGAEIWQREVDVIHPSSVPEIALEDVARHVAVAMRMRPMVNQARLQTRHGELAVVQTRNGLLPVMDLFVTLGKCGYAQAFGESIDHLRKSGYDAMAGVRVQYPFANRETGALHRRALLSRDQAHKALENLSQLVEVDVRTAYIEVQRTRQQIAASAATRRFDEEKLRIETEKLRVGKSTSFLVAQAQRDLLARRIAEVGALTDYLKALVELYRQDGSLLERRGIVAPGREPVAP